MKAMPAICRSAPAAVAEALAPQLGPAYLLACRVLGDRGLAEDAVQEALLRVAVRPPRDLGGKALAAYFLRAVHGVAVDLGRNEAARKAREEQAAVIAKPSAARPEHAAAVNEAARAARREIELLPPELRAAVCLCCEAGFTQSEAAEILEVPLGTVARRVQRGLENLRERLTRMGFAALAPAALAELLGGLGVPPVPASLAACLNGLAQGTAPAALGGTGTGFSVVKGGLIVKIGLGIAAAGLVAGTTFWAVGGKSEEAAKPPEPPKSKFATLATDPGAEWEDKGLWAGIGVSGYLDGPRREAMSYTSPRPGIFTEDGGENIFRTYDPKTERFMTVGGCGSAGELDGPLSRARFGGWGYAVFGTMAGNSKYFFMITRSKDKNSLRRFDFVKRIVEPFAKDVAVGNATKICGFEGGLFLQARDNLKKVSDDGKLLAEYKLSEVPGGYGESLGPYDAKNDRLYGSSREGQGRWVAWRWDLKEGGKLTGILLSGRDPENLPLRKQCATGPFKGSFFYCPGGMGFGPGDPDGRYPYMGGGDEANFYRLDLEKQEWIKLVPTADKKRLHFGEAPGLVQAWDAGGGVPWAGDGTDNMYPGYRGWCKIYERVK